MCNDTPCVLTLPCDAAELDRKALCKFTPINKQMHGMQMTLSRCHTMLLIWKLLQQALDHIQFDMTFRCCSEMSQQVPTEL